MSPPIIGPLCVREKDHWTGGRTGPVELGVIRAAKDRDVFRNLKVTADRDPVRKVSSGKCTIDDGDVRDTMTFVFRKGSPGDDSNSHRREETARDIIELGSVL